MREIVACVIWLVAGAVIISAMFSHTALWVAVVVVIGAVISTMHALTDHERPKPTTTPREPREH